MFLGKRMDGRMDGWLDGWTDSSHTSTQRNRDTHGSKEELFYLLSILWAVIESRTRRCLFVYPFHLLTWPPGFWLRICQSVLLLRFPAGHSPSSSAASQADVFFCSVASETLPRASLGWKEADNQRRPSETKLGCVKPKMRF